tara:strand:+ start:550 stop:768 length:219 start_codon:yes stop_codon:yes gene_type:complete
MVKLKLNRLKRIICSTCKGNGYIRVATGDTSIDFRDNSQVHQCWDCDSEGEFYETIENNNLIDDGFDPNKLH